MAFLSPSPIELMMIAVIALIVLGPSRLPDAARSLGKGMREMRNSFQGGEAEDDGGEGDRRGSPAPDADPDGGVDNDASIDAPEDDDAGEDPSNQRRTRVTQ